MKRSIPACAGEPASHNLRTTTSRVYPRVCGGTSKSQSSHHNFPGLSPRVRGNRRNAAPCQLYAGSIPACAGEPDRGVQSGILTTVYPRVCGGTKASLAAVPAGLGLSPRVRGNPFADGRKGRGRGSIPACAGEPANEIFASYVQLLSGLSPRVRGNQPTRYSGGLSTGRVYPRVCGGTARRDAGTCWASRAVYPRVCGGTSRPTKRGGHPCGLSPRVRGNRLQSDKFPVRLGSIPACAGEPLARARLGLILGVYPRVCGGTCRIPARRILRRGLSPRVRGNRTHRARRPCRTGSIPACAGEPGSRFASGWDSRVYPRVCGGTVSPVFVSNCRTGLSPRVRGNQLHFPTVNTPKRSIPACAGEPVGKELRWILFGVYPRVCGGTVLHEFSNPPVTGLSPRVRGNLRRAFDDPVPHGSIPACAGEPNARACRSGPSQVYPRVCGGTLLRSRCWCPFRGLSPRVRGTQLRFKPRTKPPRSIPACAGEP